MVTHGLFKHSIACEKFKNNRIENKSAGKWKWNSLKYKWCRKYNNNNFYWRLKHIKNTICRRRKFKITVFALINKEYQFKCHQALILKKYMRVYEQINITYQ